MNAAAVRMARGAPRLGLIGLMLVAAGVARATPVVVADPGIITVASNAIAPGGTQDFDFFNVYNPHGATVATMPDFTLLDQANNFNPGGGYSYSFLEAPGGSANFQPGIIYGSDTNVSDNLFKLTLNSSAIQSLNIYIDFGVTDLNAVNDHSITVTANGGSSATVGGIVDTRSTNNFMAFSVTGLSLGATLEFSGIGARPYIAGVTFDINGTAAGASATIVPEPGSVLLLGGAMLATLGLRRRGMAARR